ITLSSVMPFLSGLGVRRVQPRADLLAQGLSKRARVGLSRSTGLSGATVGRSRAARSAGTSGAAVDVAGGGAARGRVARGATGGGGGPRGRRPRGRGGGRGRRSGCAPRPRRGRTRWRT